MQEVEGMGKVKYMVEFIYTYMPGLQKERSKPTMFKGTDTLSSSSFIAK